MPTPRKVFCQVKQSRKDEPVGTQYARGEELGRGPRSIVFKCSRLGLADPWVMKVYPKQMSSRQRHALDAATAMGIQHKNLVYVRDLFESVTSLIVIQESLTGGQLFHRIPTLEVYNENVVGTFIKQILCGLSYLHEVGLAHRNLKPENLMLASESKNAPLKICDFYLSSLDSKEVTIQVLTRTPEFTAPEVLKGNYYTTEGDLWSAGVILYIMLCGYPPFRGDTLQALYKKIITGRVEFPGPDWTEVSTSAKWTVSRLLTYNPRERYSAKRLINTTWVNSVCSNTDSASLKRAKKKIVDFNNAWKEKSQ